MQGYRSSAACKAIVCLLYRTTFAVHSAFPAKSVSAFPPGADSQSRQLAEISRPAHGLNYELCRYTLDAARTPVRGAVHS